MFLRQLIELFKNLVYEENLCTRVIFPCQTVEKSWREVENLLELVG